MNLSAERRYDVLVVGGGPAGLGAAMALARVSRSVLVCDDNRPRNEAAAHMNNFPSADGMPPSEWRRRAKQDLLKYASVEFAEESVSQIQKAVHDFRVHLANGTNVIVRKVILATGIQDRLPEEPGFKDLWGKAIFHCPFCHGFEVKGQRLGVVGNGAHLEHFIPKIYDLSRDLVLFTNGKSDLPDALVAQLRRLNVPIQEQPIAQFEHDGRQLHHVILKTGERIARDGLFLAPRFPFQQKSPLGDQLGCEKDDVGFFTTALGGRTSVAGVFAAGDIMFGGHSVVNALASGQMAGANAAGELSSEDFLQ